MTRTSFTDNRVLGSFTGESAEIQIERKLDWLVRELDEIVAMAANKETADLIEGQRIAVGQICMRAQLVASFLMARQPTPTLVYKR